MYQRYVGIWQRLTNLRKKLAPSELFGWHYELDAAAPAITTKDELYALANAYNQTVSIELVDGTMMMVEQMEKKQVATFGGALDEWARAAYPSPSLIASMKKSGKLSGLSTQLDSLVAEVAAGSSMTTALAAYRANHQARALDKRNCVCPIFVFSCLLIDGCAGLCLLFVCTG